MRKQRLTGEKFIMHAHGVSPKREVIRLESLSTFLTKGNTLCRGDKIKEKGFGLLAVNCGRVNL